MNPRLYSYFENFDVFFPNSEDKLNKKIILKVSDFRSAMIQGNWQKDFGFLNMNRIRTELWRMLLLKGIFGAYFRRVQTPDPIPKW
jgi:hypothetical protein